MYAVKLSSASESLFAYHTPTSAFSYKMVDTDDRRPTPRSLNESSVVFVDFDNKIASTARATALLEVTVPAAEEDCIVKEKRRLIARLRMLKRLPENHDGEGASEPRATSIDAAIAFLPKLSSGHRYGVTLDDDGQAVIEFKAMDTGEFAALTFSGNSETEIEFYHRPLSGLASLTLEGTLGTNEIAAVLQSAGIFA